MLEKIETLKASKYKESQEGLNKSKRTSIPNNSIIYKGGSYVRNESPSRYTDKAQRMKNSHVSAYSKESLFYPQVDFSKLTDEQAEIIQGYIREIKLLDNDLSRKSIIKATQMIEIKPYNEEK